MSGNHRLLLANVVVVVVLLRPPCCGGISEYHTESMTVGVSFCRL